MTRASRTMTDKRCVLQKSQWRKVTFKWRYKRRVLRFHLLSVRVLVGVKLHYNDNEKATSVRKTWRKQFRVRSSWNLGMVTRKTLSRITVRWRLPT